jgi:glycosyltransferase involved in cell wall biosynthesis
LKGLALDIETQANNLREIDLDEQSILSMCVRAPALRELALTWRSSPVLQERYPLESAATWRSFIDWALLEGAQRHTALREIAPEIANIDIDLLLSPIEANADLSIHIATLASFPTSFINCADSLVQALKSCGVRVEYHRKLAQEQLGAFTDLLPNEVLHVMGQCDVRFLLQNPPLNWLITIHGAAPFSMPLQLHSAPGEDLLSLRRHADALPRVICPSFQARREISTAYEIPHEKIEPIPHFFSRQYFSAVGESFDTETPYYLVVSSYQPKKNYVTVLEAFSTYVDMPDTKANLFIAGRLNKMLEDLLSDCLFRWPNLSERVRVLNHVESLPPLYRGAMALVSLSHQEGFGMPYIEAALCGSPVIGPLRSRAVSAWTSQPTGEILGDAGLYADPQEPQHLGMLMAGLERNPQLRQALAARCRQRALEYTDPEYLVARYRHVYQEASRSSS